MHCICHRRACILSTNCYLFLLCIMMLIKTFRFCSNYAQLSAAHHIHTLQMHYNARSLRIGLDLMHSFWLCHIRTTCHLAVHWWWLCVRASVYFLFALYVCAFEIKLIAFVMLYAGHLSARACTRTHTHRQFQLCVLCCSRLCNFCLRNGELAIISGESLQLIFV